MILRLEMDWYMTMSFHFFIYTLQLIYIKGIDDVDDFDAH